MTKKTTQRIILPIFMFTTIAVNLGSLTEFLKFMIDFLPYGLIIIFALNFNKITDKLPTKYNIDEVNEAKNKNTYL